LELISFYIKIGFEYATLFSWPGMLLGTKEHARAGF
jgi:hypothetical protein